MISNLVFFFIIAPQCSFINNKGGVVNTVDSLALFYNISCPATIIKDFKTGSERITQVKYHSKIIVDDKNAIEQVGQYLDTVNIFPNGFFNGSKQNNISECAKILVYRKAKIDTIILGDYKTNALYNGQYIRDSVFYDLFVEEVNKKDQSFCKQIEQEQLIIE